MKNTGVGQGDPAADLGGQFLLGDGQRLDAEHAVGAGGRPGQ
jgi:hypothetical protein